MVNDNSEPLRYSHSFTEFVEGDWKSERRNKNVPAYKKNWGGASNLRMMTGIRGPHEIIICHSLHLLALCGPMLFSFSVGFSKVSALNVQPTSQQPQRKEIKSILKVLVKSQSQIPLNQFWVLWSFFNQSLWPEKFANLSYLGLVLPLNIKEELTAPELHSPRVDYQVRKEGEEGSSGPAQDVQGAC